jgi:poly(A) polymerase
VKPKKYTQKKHNIDIEKIDKHALYIIEKLKAKGFVAFLVGGSVRDLLQGLTPKDFDIVTSAKPQEIKSLFRNCILIGKRFRLAHVRFGRKIIEVSTFRAGDIEEKTLIIQDNVWGDPKEDASRRDFTINGLFYDPEDQSIIDYVDGFPDTEKKLLRAIGTAHLRFTQDPVRMIRLLKFKARLLFDLDNETHSALTKCKKMILKSSPARILEELLRMLESGHSCNFIKLIHEYGILELLIPKLASFMEQDIKNDIFLYLENADDMAKKSFKNSIDRSIFVSAIIFPIFQKKIKELSEKNKRLHLGIIAEEARNLLYELFCSFHIPKKIKAAIISIITHQYRFYLFEKKYIRIPRDVFFPLAMQFFKLRCNIDPELIKPYTQWNEKIVKSHQKSKKKKFFKKKK